MEPDYLVNSLYSLFITNGINEEYTERCIRSDFDELEGDGALDQYLDGATLKELLSSSHLFISCGPQKWKIAEVTENAKEILNTMRDNKKGARPKRRGVSAPSRGRGGGSVRRGFNDHRRGNNFSRGTHGSTFRPAVPSQNRSSYTPQVPPQRPLVRNGPGPSDYDRNRSDHVGRNSSRNGSNFGRPVSPHRSPPRHHAPSRDYSPHPRPYSPPRNRSPRDDYRRNDRDYPRYDNQDGYNHPDNRPYDNYNHYDSRRQSPDFRRTPSRQDTYQGDRRRSPSPGYDFSQRSAQPSRSYQDTRNHQPSYDAPYNDSIHPTSHNNEYPPRPESASSDGFSQVSDNGEVTMSSNSQDRFRANMTVTSPLMADIQKRFNTTYVSKDDKTAKNIAKEIRAYMIQNSPKSVLLEELLNHVAKKYSIPGGNVEEKEVYINQLKEILPEILDQFVFDDKEFVYSWGRENLNKAIAENSFDDDSKEDNIHHLILRYIDSLPHTFSRVDAVTSLMVETGIQDYSRIEGRFTYILFVKLKGQYVYSPGSDTHIRKVGAAELSEFFTAPLEHKLFDGPRSKSVKVECSRFLSFSRFAVRPVQYMDEFEKMEKEIRIIMESEGTADAPSGGWKKHHGCLCKLSENNSNDKYTRGLIIRKENELYRVYLLDIGNWQMFSPRDLSVLPPKFRTVPPYAILCTLHAEEVDFAMLEDSPMRETFKNCATQFEIQIEDEKLDDGIKTYSVSVFTYGANGSLKNIVDDIY